MNISCERTYDTGRSYGTETSGSSMGGAYALGDKETTHRRGQIMRRNDDATCSPRQSSQTSRWERTWWMAGVTSVHGAHTVKSR